MKALTRTLAVIGVVLMAGAQANAAILANIGETSISSEQIKRDYESVTVDQKKAINEDVVTRKNIVENAINSEVMYMAAKKAGLDKDEEYKAALDRFQRQFLASRFLQKAVEPKLNRDGIKKFFDENKTFFDSTEVCAHHIVITDEAEAKKVLTLVKAKGAKFEDLAVKHSMDPTVQENKGNLGCFTRDKMVAEFAAAAFDMKKGEVKGLVRTMYGYHIIRMDGVKAGKIPNYEEVEQKVKETYRLKLVTETIQDLRKKADVKLNEEEISKLRL